MGGLDTIFKLSVFVNMIDNLTGPSRQINSAVDSTTKRLDNLRRSYAETAQTGAIVSAAGVGITKGVLSPVEATFETQKALGELSSVGIENMEALEKAAVEFSNTWSGTTKAEFISSAYDIKSGISSLADEGVAQYTKLSGLTAKATKSSVDEMTSLFATGYGVYKDFYSNMSDIEFGEMFSAGISRSVKQFKTTGSQMAQAIETLGASATTAKVPLEEQLAIMGMLQATMSGSEAGTKYNSFIKNAAKAGKELGLTFVDTNNELLSLPEILETLKGKFGETMDAAEKLELQKAFGRQEAVALVDLLYNKTGDLQRNIVDMHKSMGKGTEIAEEMAGVMNKDPGSQYELLKQQAHNLKEEMGKSLIPTVLSLIKTGSQHIENITKWVNKNKELTSIIMKVVLAVGILITIFGGMLAVFGIGGMVVTTAIKNMVIFKGVIGKLGSNTLKAAKGVGSLTLRVAKMGLEMVKTAGVGIKNFALGIFNMTKQAVIAGAKALPGLIGSVWSFTTALLANPITWIVIGVIALIAALYLLWKHFDKVSSFVSGVFNGALNLIGNAFGWVKEKVDSLPQGFVLLLSAIFPVIGIPALIIRNWDKIISFFNNLFSNLTSLFRGLPIKIKEAVLQKLNIFKESGKKIMETLGKGITDGVMAPINAVKKGLAKIRNLLPFSDAKEGPLSQLTLSGRKIFQTLSAGMEIEAPILKRTTELAFAGMINPAMPQFEKASFGRDRRIEKIDLKEIIKEKDSQSREKIYYKEDDKKIIIEKLELKVENIKDIAQLMDIIKELEDQVESDTDDDGDDI
ncbi:phage tail tape measure protein [Maledivibacter halophilus]|uniref:Phage tail tape measure protein, TP901 family, core region n=1 Tax=Maledivibacter halophilus TaxID=36842 RepID=A0A1T5LX45_9FIRM|nr:phage tail tape measure protein [Maledivibacter halophilus]SKC68245.1 phage tail tape measure protein, TP901 family, core region [Maledivibacter halophilus]SKC71848.1 phage tail tape measure protein, TP901 family, core region [Maledivibacter halophilus]SKC80148.1 phage tail tape measure protein, TP901 family, core region [Maledivibacter halophilus]